MSASITHVDKIENPFDINDLNLHKKVGSGSFGKVYKVQKNKTGEIFAAKVSKETIEGNPDMARDISRELSIISKLNHPGVLKYYGYSLYDFKMKPRPTIITEFVSNGTLGDLIELGRESSSNSDLDDTRKLIIIYGIASSMSYLHANGIIHRDLKPDNIFLDEFLLPKVADFGLSKFTQKQENFGTNTMDGTVKGTPIYISPEIWSDTQYTKACDVYAFAIIVYEIITNEKPFNNCHFFEISIKVHSGYRPEFPDTNLPKSYVDLIEKCWAQDPLNRPTFDQILLQLKTDRGFITENVDEEEYKNYIKYIDEYTITFDPSKRVDLTNKYIRGKKQLFQNDENDHIRFDSLKLYDKKGLFDCIEFDRLDDKCKNIIQKANNDKDDLFKISQYLIEGQYDFHQNVQLGIKYLMQSINNGCIDAISYYFNILIKGKIIPKNYKKAKKLIETKLKDHNDLYSLLTGKLLKKENKFEEAKKFFEISIEKGNSEAFYEYAKLLLKGKGCDINKEKAMEYLKKAIDNGCSKAMFKFGLIMKNEEKQNKEGEKYIKMAANKGCLKAIYYYSLMLKNADGVKYDIEESNKYLKMAADKGHTNAIYEYANLLYNSSSRHDYNLSLKLLEKASEKNHLDAMHIYGIILAEGRLIKPRYYEGINYIKYSALDGNTEALIDYAKIQFSNYGLNKDKEVGIECLKKAIELGSPKAMSMYGILLSEKNNVIENNYVEAVKYLKMAIDNGDTEAMNQYAYMLSVGKGVKMNKEEAIKYYKMGIQQGDPESMNYYGLMLEEGDGVPVNYEEAIKYYEMAIEKGNVKAMFNYGIMLFKGKGVPINKKEGIKYIRNSANNGLVHGMYFYANVLNKGDGIEVNKEKASKYYKMAADKGDSYSMNSYAVMLFNGDGIEVNKEEAIKYFKMAIAKGDVGSMNNYAIILLNGNGLPANKKEALKYFKMAAEKGSTEALINLSYMYLNGDGIPVDLQEGIKCLKIAMNKNHHNAYYIYGTLLEQGKGVEINLKEAVKYYEIAADQGNISAITALGRMLYKGDGINQNKKKGFHYLKLASDNGSKIATQLLEDIIQTDGYFGEEEEYNDDDDDDDHFGFFVDPKDPDALNRLGLAIYLSKGTLISKSKAMTYFKMAADQGHVDAMANYSIYLLECGDDSDLKEAAKYSKMAAEKGHKTAMANYAEFLYNGIGIPMNIKEAAHYYKILADHDDVSSMFKYGKILINGDGIEKNIDEGIKYLEMAVDNGCIKAMSYYGNLLVKGDKIQINLEKGINLIKLAADKGDPDALFHYGQLFENGIGVKVNKKKASKYYYRSYGQGNKNALHALMLLNIDEKEEEEEEKEEEEANDKVTNLINMINLLCH